MIHASPCISTADTRPLEASDYDDVLPVVRRIERIETVAPRAIMIVFIGLPILLGMLHGHPIFGLLNAVALGFVGAFLCRVVAVAILAPIHALQYGRVMRSLAATLDTLAPDATTKAQWIAGAPGALAITRASTLLLVDRSTDYRFISLADEEIVAVDRQVDEDVRMTTRRRSSLTLGAGLGRGIFGGWTVGGRTVSNARIMRSTTVVLRYQREEDPTIRCALIPFGPDDLGAENLRIALDRVRNAAAN
ncbi:hypothetical protein DMC47_35265 [Nostoc sp. 3335mG]|nr:hypothetical protein DMC47_35265 [Nostoc sp. 3335mG]